MVVELIFHLMNDQKRSDVTPYYLRHMSKDHRAARCWLLRDHVWHRLDVVSGRFGRCVWRNEALRKSMPKAGPHGDLKRLHDEGRKLVFGITLDGLLRLCVCRL